MKVTVCEINKSIDFQNTWISLKKHLANNESELLLLPEMPFHNWVCKTQIYDSQKWKESVEAHNTWIKKLDELNTEIVVASRPISEKGKNYNEGFIWTKKNGYKACHRKVYLPNLSGFYEAEWYKPGLDNFEVYNINGVNFAFVICTELWFMNHIKEYSKQALDILLCPRSTPLNTKNKWLCGGVTASVLSGAYTLSSNFSGIEEGNSFAGFGWITEPEDGNVIATTSETVPFITLDIDLSLSEKAKTTYPRVL